LLSPPRLFGRNLEVRLLLYCGLFPFARSCPGGLFISELRAFVDLKVFFPFGNLLSPSPSRQLALRLWPQDPDLGTANEAGADFLTSLRHLLPGSVPSPL